MAEASKTAAYSRIIDETLSPNSLKVLQKRYLKKDDDGNAVEKPSDMFIRVAENIAAEVEGRAPTSAFDGAGFCYIETGGGEAVRGDGEFFADPHPTMTAKPPDRAQAEEKHRWVRDWLAKYM